MLGACGMILAMFSAGARAQTAEDLQVCQHAKGHSDDDIIAACTAAINSGQGDAETRTDEYAQRGAAYDRENHTGAAISDYRAALQITPDDIGLQTVLDDAPDRQRSGSQ